MWMMLCVRRTGYEAQGRVKMYDFGGKACSLGVEPQAAGKEQ